MVPGDQDNTFPPDVPVVIFASACWETPTPVNVHHVARRLAQRGHDVLFVESTGIRAPSLGSSHDTSRIRRRLRDWRAGVRTIEPRLHVLSPLALPWSVPRPLRALSMRGIARAIRRASRRLGFDRPVIWAFLPTAARVPDALPHRALVYHCVDHYAANPGVDREWIDDLEAALLQRADLVLATSEILGARLRDAGREDVVTIPNVADVTRFRQAVTDDLPEPDLLRAVPRPRVVYVGNLAQYRIDLDLLDALASRRPDVQFACIGVVGLGDVGDADDALGRFAGRSNVHLLGAVPPSELPACLRHADVAIIPFLDNEHTRGSLPLKLWEYVGAGLPVIATDLPNFVEPAQAGAVRVARGADAWQAALDAALRDTTERATQSARADGHDWDTRMDDLVARVGATIATRSSTQTARRRR